jgi:methylthioribose-1-phosphate isomerase
MKNGDSIEIEERDPEEITKVMGQLIGPKNVSTYNPVFDITPAKYVSGIITEKGVASPPYRASLKKLFSA